MINLFFADGTLYFCSVHPLIFSAHASTVGTSIPLNKTEVIDTLLTCASGLCFDSDYQKAGIITPVFVEKCFEITLRYAFLPMSPATMESLSKIRSFFSRAAVRDIESVLMAASESICERLPIGHSWGENPLTKQQAKTATVEYGFVRSVLVDKWIAHAKLLWVLVVSVITLYSYVSGIYSYYEF
jgi:hypothetical protein